MTPRKPKESPARTKWLSDPMVAIAPGVVRAAIELDGRGFAAIARDVTRALPRSRRRFNENRQTLYALYNGGRRCRESRRLALADVFDVPASWLQASVVPLPLTGAYHTHRLWYSSPRVALALGRLLQRCSEACIRDLTRYEITTREGDQGELLRFEISNLLCWAIAQLVSPVEKIGKFLVPRGVTQPTKEPGATGPFVQQQMPANEEACWLASIRMWGTALEPWVAAEQSLQYRAFADAAAALYPLMHLQRPRSTLPLRVVELANRKEVILSEVDTPFSLMPRLPNETTLSTAGLDYRT